jgi:hypothetical protein
LKVKEKEKRKKEERENQSRMNQNLLPRVVRFLDDFSSGIIGSITI